MSHSNDRFAIYPVIPLGNGYYSISDETLVQIFERIVQEQKLEQLFYDGSIKDIQGWLNLLKQPGTLPFIVWDAVKKKVVGIAWLKDISNCCAWIHHCAIGPYQRGVWEALRDHLKQIKPLKLLLGTTPVSHKKAIKLLKNICKFTVVGEIPHVCNLAYEGKRVPGVLSYFEL